MLRREQKLSQVKRKGKPPLNNLKPKPVWYTPGGL